MVNEHPLCRNIAYAGNNSTIAIITDQDKAIRKGLSLFFLIGGLLHIILCLSLFILLNRDGRIHHIKIRSTILVLSTSLGVLLHLIFAFVPPLAGSFPTWIIVLFLLLIVPFVTIPIPIKLFNFYARYIFSRAVAEAYIDETTTDPSSKSHDGNAFPYATDQNPGGISILSEQNFEEGYSNHDPSNKKKNGMTITTTSYSRASSSDETSSQHGSITDVNIPLASAASGKAFTLGKIQQTASSSSAGDGNGNGRVSNLSDNSAGLSEQKDETPRGSFTEFKKAGGHARASDLRATNLSMQSYDLPDKETALPSVAEAEEAIAAVGLRSHSVIGNGKTKKISTRSLIFLKFIASKKAQSILLFLYFAPFIAVIIANFVLIPELNPAAGCVNAPYLPASAGLLIAFAAIAGILGIVGPRLVKKLNDPFGITTECKVYAQYGGALAFLSMILQSVVPNLPYGFTFHYLVSIGLQTMLFSISIYQIYIGVKKYTDGKFTFQIFWNILLATCKRKRRGRDTRESFIIVTANNFHEENKKLEELSTPQKLLEMLQKPKETEDFENFLIGEFSVEMLRMYIECRNWERSYFDSSEATRRARAKKIIQLFIDENAIFQVNLPGTIRSDLINAISNSQKELPRDLFKKSQKEMLLMMHGAFRRYIKRNHQLKQTQ